MHIEYCNLCDHTEMAEKAAQWFHEKWKVPYEEYLTSINQSLCAQSAVPQWYMALEGGRIIERGDHDDLIAQKGRYYQLYTGGAELE